MGRNSYFQLRAQKTRHPKTAGLMSVTGYNVRSAIGGQGLIPAPGLLMRRAVFIRYTRASTERSTALPLSVRRVSYPRRPFHSLKLVIPAGLEPATCGFEVRHSIQLSYRRNMHKLYWSLFFNKKVAKKLEALHKILQGVSLVKKTWYLILVLGGNKRYFQKEQMAQFRCSGKVLFLAENATQFSLNKNLLEISNPARLI